MKLIVKFFKVTYLWLLDGVHDVRRDLGYIREKRLRKKMMLLADERAKATGKKQWVVRDYRGKMVVYNRAELVRLRELGFYSKQVTMQDFDRDALYVAQIDNRKRIKKDTSDYEKRVVSQRN